MNYRTIINKATCILKEKSITNAEIDAEDCDKWDQFFITKRISFLLFIYYLDKDYLIFFFSLFLP